MGTLLSCYQYKNNFKRKKCQISTHWTSKPPLTSFYLFVEQDVDDGVVQGGALGEKSRRRHEHGPELNPLVGENVQGHAGVGHPAHQEGDDHDNHHAGDLPLRPLGGLRLLLLGCSLKEAGYHSIGGTSQSSRRTQHKSG